MMMSAALERLSRPLLNFFAPSGSDMEPDPEEYPMDRSTPLFRLFVAWVPKLFTEHDLRPLFAQCGDVKDIVILKDKATGGSRGCAFVSYATSEEAHRAISVLDKAVLLPQASQHMEVRFARSSNFVVAGQGPDNNRQLFFAHMPTTATEEDISRLFGQFGQVESVDLFHDRRTRVSKGCGFVAMATREAAAAAMEALDDKLALEGTTAPLAVKWADPDLQYKKRKAGASGNAENRMLFFAKVLRTATEDDVRQLFSQFGPVAEVNMFRAFQGAPTTKGCGLITMGTNEAALAAIQALDGRYTWGGMDAPMVVKWMDVALQKRRREEHLLAMRHGLSRVGNRGLVAQSEVDKAALLRPMVPVTGIVPDCLADMPPLGCVQDAYKLFIGNLPKHLTEDDLLPIFSTVGKVVECYVVRDKGTSESKGSAFIWYVNKAQADAAVEAFNNRHTLPDPKGEMVRPMVVRRANSRKAVSTSAYPFLSTPNPGTSGSGLGGGGGPLLGSGPSAANAAGLGGGGSMLSSGGMAGSSEVMPVHIQPIFSQQMFQSVGGMASGSGPVNNITSLGSNLMDASGSFIDSSYMSFGDSLMQQAGAGAGAAVAAQQQQQMGGLGGSGMAPPINYIPTVGSGLPFGRPGGMAPQYPQQALAQQQQQQAQQVAAQQQQQAMAAIGGASAMAVGAGLPGAPGGPGGPMTLAVNTGQLQLLQLHSFDIQNMTRTSITTHPVAQGLFCVTINGVPGQVEAASQMINALLSTKA